MKGKGFCLYDSYILELHGICFDKNLASVYQTHTNGHRIKYALQRFNMLVELVLVVSMPIQEVADMLFT